MVNSNSNDGQYEDYSIVFKQIDQLCSCEDMLQIMDNVQELEEISELREIILQTTSQQQGYFTST